jgi:hypothetical protein
MTPNIRRRLLAVGVAAAACAALALPVGAHAPRLTASDAHFIRGAYGKDASSTGYGTMQDNGFNTVMTGPYRELLDPVAAAGLRGVVWLGNFLNAPKCAFEKDDATVIRLVTAIAGSPVIAAYYLGDEPHVTECPQAPSLFKQRSELVHKLDPGSQTFTVIQASENGVSHDYAPWAGAVDIIGFDVYPCSRSAPKCSFGLIDDAVRAIRAAGIKRYWAIIQDFKDCYYSLPTPAELTTQFDHWARSDMSGYFVFSWNYQPANPACAGVALDNQPDNIAALKTQNSRQFVDATPTSERGQAWHPVPWNAMIAIAVMLGAVLIFLGTLAVRARPRRS